jgi:hypothetical protein
MKRKVRARDRFIARNVTGKSLRRLGLEGLEDRRMMAVGSVTLNQTSGVLTILGSNAYADTVNVSIDGGHLLSPDDDQVVVRLQNTGPELVQKFAVGALAFGVSPKVSAVTKIVFQGYGGNDWFDNLTSIKSDAYGGAGLDTLLGGSNVDQFWGGDQDDYLDGRLGNDILRGENHRDAIFGDVGDDKLYGGGDIDWLHGGAGFDTLLGEAGNDWLFGGAGGDSLNGGAGTNILYADYGTANSPVAGYDRFDWFDRNLDDAALRSLARVKYRDGALDRSDMLSLYDQTKRSGGVTEDEFGDLQSLTSQHLAMSDPIRSLALKLAYGDLANNWYHGGALGNLAPGSTGEHLQLLVNKWFLGLDRPAAERPYLFVQGSLYVNGPSYSDIDQQYLGDCYFLAALADVAQESTATIESMITDNLDGTYAVRFYRGNQAEYVTVDRYLPVRNQMYEDGTSQYAGFGGSYVKSTNELWVALVEKAYAQVNESGWIDQDGTNTYIGITGGWPEGALEHITGKDAVTRSLQASAEHALPADKLSLGIRGSILSAESAGATITFITNYSGVDANVVPNHVYSLVGYDATTQKFKLYNPWGVNNGMPGTLDLTWDQVVNNFTSWSSVQI